jgi:drug/metabolite transporter (DMT)-like permease
VILPLPHFQRLHWRHYKSALYLMVLVAAIGTASYTLIDDEALRQLRQSESIQLNNTQVTLLFIALQTASTALMLGLATRLHRPQRRQFQQLRLQRSLIISATATGLVIVGTYGLVLAAMAFVSNVSYVAAFRQLSIPIGAFLGITLQHEPKYKPKLAGIAIVLAGLILVGIG